MYGLEATGSPFILWRSCQIVCTVKKQPEALMHGVHATGSPSKSYLPEAHVYSAEATWCPYHIYCVEATEVPNVQHMKLPEAHMYGADIIAVLFIPGSAKIKTIVHFHSYMQVFSDEVNTRCYFGATRRIDQILILTGSDKNMPLPGGAVAW